VSRSFGADHTKFHVCTSRSSNRTTSHNLTLRLATIFIGIFFQKILHRHIACSHKIANTRYGHRIQPSATYCNIGSDSNEANELVGDRCHVLTDHSYHGSSLLSLCIRIKLTPIDSRPILRKQPGLWYRLDQPIMIIDCSHTFGVSVSDS